MLPRPPRRAVAPLPDWPIHGIKFSPNAHLSRVLAVLQCNPSCRLARDDSRYLGSVFSNSRDPETGLQIEVPGTDLFYARNDFWANRDGGHSHDVTGDLVYPYIRIHQFPFTFSRPIFVCSRTEDDTVSRLYVADIHLRWSEIELGIQDRSYIPLRYTVDGYPFNTDYFELARSLFGPQIPYIPTPLHAYYPCLVHDVTGRILELCPFSILERRLEALTEGFGRPDDNGLPLLARLSTAWITEELEQLYGRWWLHTEQAIYEYRRTLFRRFGGIDSAPVPVDDRPRILIP